MEVRTDEELGQGVIWEIDSDEILIVTAHHVVYDKEKDVCVTFTDNHSVKAEVLVDDVMDVTLLGVDKKQLERSTLSQIKAIKPSKFFAQDNDEPIMADAFELILGKSRYKTVSGEVEYFRNFVYDIDRVVLVGKMEAHEGMSGGGLFDREGGFLGIIQAGNDEGTLIGTDYLSICDYLGR